MAWQGESRERACQAIQGSTRLSGINKNTTPHGHKHQLFNSPKRDRQHPFTGRILRPFLYQKSMARIHPNQPRRGLKISPLILWGLKMIPALTMVIIVLALALCSVSAKKDKAVRAVSAFSNQLRERCEKYDELRTEMVMVKMDAGHREVILDRHILRSAELFDEWRAKEVGYEDMIAELKGRVSELERFIAAEGIEFEWVDVGEMQKQLKQL